VNLIRDELGLDPNRPVAGLFTNVLWDAQIYYDSSAFSNTLEWLFSTIDYFIERRPDWQLLIRIHPGEIKGTHQTNQPLLNEIIAHYPSLPKNIFIVAPASDISSYALLEIIRVAIIYATNMGLETAVRGIPTIIAGNNYARNKGFTYDMSSKEDYFRLLDNLDQIECVPAEVIARARKFAYHHYFRRMLDFDAIRVKNPLKQTGLRLNFRSLSDLTSGGDLDPVCNGIIYETEFINPS